MKLKPKKWTHHHAARLYHISRLLTFIFIAGACLYGFFAILFFSSATEIIVPQTLSITATVAGAEEGPTIRQDNSFGGGGSYAPATDGKPALKRIIVGPIIPVGSAGQISVTGDKGQEVSLELFKTQYPSFAGKINIPKALVLIQIKNKITLRSTAVASADGTWEWQSTKPLFLGNNTITITAQDPNDPNNIGTQTLDFYIDPASVANVKQFPQSDISKAEYAGNSFDVTAIVPEYFKIIQAGGELVANIRLVNFGARGKTVDVVVHYQIQNVRGENILDASETLAVTNQLSYLKTFYTSQSLEEGPYQIIVTVPSKNIIATAYDNFQIIKKPSTEAVGSTENNNSKGGIASQALLGIMFLSAMIAYFEYNKAAQLTKIIKRVGDAEFISAA